MSKRTCKFSDCVKPVLARKMCRGHYMAWRRDNPDKIRPGRSEHRELVAATVLQCRQCGDGFFPVKSLGKRYCSEFCSRKWHRENAPGECKVAECVSVVKARGMCAKHYSAWRRAEGLDTWKDAWTPARKAAYQARRARKRGVDAERVVAAEVFDRDGWLCGICGGEVDSGLEWPDSGSASLDHVVPLSKGGAHTYENTQLAHLFCNVSKGDSLPIGREALSA